MSAEEMVVSRDTSGHRPVVFNVIKKIFLVSVMAVLFGCSYFVSWDDISKPLIGHPLTEITKFESWRNPEKVWERQDGRTVYKYHLEKLDPSCVHYWVVDNQGIIVDYYFEGHCRPVG